MLELLHKVYPEQMASPEWQNKIRAVNKGGFAPFIVGSHRRYRGVIELQNTAGFRQHLLLFAARLVDCAILY
jgi:peptidoglycan/xylan/chitin deacetylase (PgdA/CDA1 family)